MRSLIFLLLLLTSCTYLQGFFSKKHLEITQNTQIQILLPNGWEINKDAPSSLEVRSSDKKVLYSWNKEVLRSGELRFIAVESVFIENQGLLVGKLFYCEKIKPEICKMKSISKKVVFINSSIQTLVALDIEEE